MGAWEAAEGQRREDTPGIKELTVTMLVMAKFGYRLLRNMLANQTLGSDTAGQENAAEGSLRCGQASLAAMGQRAPIHDADGVAVLFLAQLDFPVADVNEMLPDVVWDSIEVEVEVGTPDRFFRFSDEGHPGLLGDAVGLSCVAVFATAHNILPGGFSAEVARNNVVEVEVFSIHGLAAILAGVFVPLVDVLAGELDFFVGGLVVEDEDDDRRDGYSVVDSVNELERSVRGAGKVPPLVKGEVAEGAVLLEDGLGVPLVEHADGPASRADIHRLPQPVEHQDVLVKGT